MKLQEVVEALQAGRGLGPKGPIQASEVRLTRKALLIFGSDFVLKLRRPRIVDAENQETLGARLLIARRERWIGRRASPTTYLGDACLVFPGDGTFELRKGDMAGAEPIVAMRRLADADRLDALLADASVGPERLFGVMDHLADFHGKAPVHRQQDDVGRPGRFQSSWRQTLKALGAATEGSPALQEVVRARGAGWAELGEALHAPLRDILPQRVAEGRIRHIHGELRLVHLFSPEGRPVGLIDPADGEDEARFVDTAEELAGLVLELRMVRTRGFVDALLRRYAEQTSDRTLWKVIHAYAALVAMRRAVQAAREGEDGEAGAHDRALVFLDAVDYAAAEFEEDRQRWEAMRARSSLSPLDMP